MAAQCEKVVKYRRHLQKRQASESDLQNYKNRNSVLYIPLNKPKTKKCHDQSAGALVGLTQVNDMYRRFECPSASRHSLYYEYRKPRRIPFYALVPASSLLLRVRVHATSPTNLHLYGTSHGNLFRPRNLASDKNCT